MRELEAWRQQHAAEVPLMVAAVESRFKALEAGGKVLEEKLDHSNELAAGLTVQLAVLKSRLALVIAFGTLLGTTVGAVLAHVIDRTLK